MNMKHWSVSLLLVAACSLSAAAGFWFGFREAWYLGPAADLLPRGVLATSYLKSIAAGKSERLVSSFENDVDNGLIFGYDVFHHPLRDFLGPVWGIEVYPEYEKYAVRLADYRREHPLKLTPVEAALTSEMSKGLEESYREVTRKLDSMVERYATNRSHQAPNRAFEAGRAEEPRAAQRER